MYRTTLLLGITSFMLASTAHAQMAERSLLNLIPTRHGSVGTSAPGVSVPGVTGDRALLGTTERRPASEGAAGATPAPIDGTRALLGRWPSPFVGKVRGDVSEAATGPAEFGRVRSGEGSPSAFVVSLGGRGEGGALLFTYTGGAPLRVGRYRISEAGDGTGEVLALVMTGTPTAPTGVFRGRSGWLLVTAASDGLLTGRFELDAIGFRAADPEREDRTVSVSGSFSAGAAASSAPGII